MTHGNVRRSQQDWANWLDEYAYRTAFVVLVADQEYVRQSVREFTRALESVASKLSDGAAAGQWRAAFRAKEMHITSKSDALMDAMQSDVTDKPASLRAVTPG